jgi:peptide/nickel transport system substrate-binding protein
VDGQPLPYLDGITFLQLGEGREPELAALQTGDVDTVPEPTVEMWETLKDDDRFDITSLPTAATRLLRVRCDQEPWTDNRVRLALKYCHDREKILAVALRNQGTIGNDSHAAPAHLDYSGEVEPLPFDTERARALLSEAGYPDGISFDLIFASSWGETMAYAQALKEDAVAGGFDIRLNPMPDGQFWDGWLDWNASVTWWAHAPLCETDLVSAYTVDSEGQPAVWNESRWIDPEFCTLLDEACRTLDLAARKRIVAQLERIQRDRGSIATPFFMNVWAIVNKRVHGVRALERELADYYEAWKEPEV